MGENPSEAIAPSASATEDPTGLSIPTFGFCSTITSSASPQVLPVSSAKLERPTDQAGYWLIIPSVREATSNITNSQAPTPSGLAASGDQRR